MIVRIAAELKFVETAQEWVHTGEFELLNPDGQTFTDWQIEEIDWLSAVEMGFIND